METWKTNLDETKKRYIDWWNHKGIMGQRNNLRDFIFKHII